MSSYGSFEILLVACGSAILCIHGSIYDDGLSIKHVEGADLGLSGCYSLSNGGVF